MQSSFKKPLIVLGLILLFFVGKHFYLAPKFSDGENVPTFSSKLADGSSFELSSLKGKYVLLQFWGSWCGPCRRENPELVQLYQDLHAQNFEIVSIGLEKNSQSWQKAITNDGLIWPYHILQDGSFNSPIATLYAVKQIPTLYLLGPDQRVILTNPTPIEVKNYIQNRSL
ncbi:MAG: TlpA family protein disulfide reductase [Saprospiraceae bacterium]|nr:TlpA family protein disulfide reductase [Saprospiraceae bacterium]